MPDIPNGVSCSSVFLYVSFGRYSVRISVEVQLALLRHIEVFLGFCKDYLQRRNSVLTRRLPRSGNCIVLSFSNQSVLSATFPQAVTLTYASNGFVSYMEGTYSYMGGFLVKT